MSTFYVWNNNNQTNFTILSIIRLESRGAHNKRTDSINGKYDKLKCESEWLKVRNITLIKSAITLNIMYCVVTLIVVNHLYMKWDINRNSP